MSSQSKSKELIVSTKAKEKLPVKYNESSVLDLVDNEIFLENRNEVKKYLPEILGRVLARIWIDENFKNTLFWRNNYSRFRNVLFLGKYI